MVGIMAAFSESCHDLGSWWHEAWWMETSGVRVYCCTGQRYFKEGNLNAFHVTLLSYKEQNPLLIDVCNTLMNWHSYVLILALEASSFTAVQTLLLYHFYVFCTSLEKRTICNCLVGNLVWIRNLSTPKEIWLISHR